MSLMKRRSAILGALLSDAATMPLHWIYDMKKFTEIVGSKCSTPEFFATPSCPFYGADQYPVGRLSPYGDEVMVLLKCMAEQGQFEAKLFGAATLEFANGYTGRLNHAIKDFKAAVDAGKPLAEAGSSSSLDAHSITKVPIVVARYAGQPEMVEKVLEAVRVHQVHPVAAESAVSAAVLLERVILGSPLSTALAEAVAVGSPAEGHRGEFEEAVQSIESTGSLAETAGALGRSCRLPNALKVVVAGLHKADKEDASFEQAVRDNILAGGDNCSRAILLGAVMAAARGSVPEAWAASVDPELWREVGELADAVLAPCSGNP